MSRLMADPTLFTPDFKPPRNIIVLCHGLSLPLLTLPYIFLDDPPIGDFSPTLSSNSIPVSKGTPYSSIPQLFSLLRNPGLYGFSTATPIPLFPSLKLHYWAAVLEVLRDRLGAKVMVVGVKGTGSIEERAKMIHEYLEANVPVGTGLNFVAHSMVSKLELAGGGLVSDERGGYFTLLSREDWIVVT